MEKTGLPRKEAMDSVELFLDSVKEGLKAGQKVCIVGFGTFIVKNKDSRNGRNPRTGESIRIPEKRVAYFKPGKAFRETVKPADDESTG
jgi:nucleoid DNA-binding protein